MSFAKEHCSIEVKWDHYEHQLLDWNGFSFNSPFSENGMFVQSSLSLGAGNDDMTHCDSSKPTQQTKESGDLETPSSSVSSVEDRRKSEISGFVNERRRAQNRDAQRAFRIRQKKHTEILEVKMKSILKEYEHLQHEHTVLRLAHQTLQGMKPLCDSCLAGYRVPKAAGAQLVDVVCLDCDLSPRGGLGSVLRREEEVEEKEISMWRELDHEVWRAMNCVLKGPSIQHSLPSGDFHDD